MLLAHAGAEVIKVEPPVTGERSRSPGLTIDTSPDEPVSLQYIRVNRGKKGVTLSLRHERGRALFRQLAAISDVVVENFRPGAMRNLGLDYDGLKESNPRLIYATISGFGRRADLAGPYSDRAANNPSAQAMSGLMDVTGEPGGPPSLVGASIGDTIPGLWTAYAILLALEQRRKTGQGQFIDIAMYDCLVVHNDTAVPFFDLTGISPGREREDMWSAQIKLAASDGFVMMSGAVSPEKWAALWQAVGRPDLTIDSRYLGLKIDGPFFLREITPALEGWSQTRTRNEVCSLLLGIGFSAAAVQTAAEVYRCPHLAARSMFDEFEFVGKHFRQPSNPAKMTNVPHAPGAAPPRLGQHNREIFVDRLGLSEEELNGLYSDGTSSAPLAR